jgi:hypothetical protein
MNILITLFLITLIIIWMQIKIWKVKKSIVFPLITSIFYFWSLAGAWLFIFDNFTKYGLSIGLNYHYLMDKMFHVYLDSTYWLTIVLYGSFIIIFQYFIWIGLKLTQKYISLEEKIDSHKLKLKSLPFILIAIVCLFCSFYIIKDVVYYSLILDESLYINIRGSKINYYTIHQYLNWIMIVSLFIYVGLYYKNNDKIISVSKPSLFFWVIFVICNVYLISIGSRHETFFAGILFILLISFPHRSIIKNWKLYFVFFLTFGLILALNDPIRSLMPRIANKIGITSIISNNKRIEEARLYQFDRSFSEHHSIKKSKKAIYLESIKDTIIKIDQYTFKMKKAEFYRQQAINPNYLKIGKDKILIPNPHISTAYDRYTLPEKLIRAFTTMIFSNELFAGHFSLYGILKFKVKPSYGISFVSLLESFKSQNKRNPYVLDSYQYYAKKLNLPKDQGFTINNISSWFLNFSYYGLIIGPFILALIFLLPYYMSYKGKKILSHSIWIIILLSITSFSAILVRSGPEALKALLIESVLIPVIIVYSSYLILLFYMKNFNKNNE